MLVPRVIGFASAFAVVAATWMLPSAPTLPPALEDDSRVEIPLETFYAINTFDAEAACCAGGVGGGADPTGNECTSLEDVAAEYVNGRRVIDHTLLKRLSPPEAGATISD